MSIKIENCLDTMAALPENSIDLVITSPPYDNLRTYNGFSFDFPAVAAIELGRQWLGSEISHEYAAIAQERIKKIK